MNQSLRVHSIESFGTNDGPGIRLVIFLQGCNIKCLYCQNADTIPCTQGLEYTLTELVQKAIRMKPYFGNIGGVTISGGEPLMQSQALIPFFEILKDEGIHTNIDTNGTIVNTYSKKLITELSDLVMFDLKGATPQNFKQMTGKQLYYQSESLIKLRIESQKPFWFRYVLVPGYTDSSEYLHLLGEKYGKYKNIERFQVLPYHKLGIHKWELMGENYTLKDTPENTEEQIQIAKDILKKYFECVV